MLEQASRLWRDLPLTGTRQGAPGVHMSSNFLNEGGDVVLLLLRGKPIAFVENKCLLCGRLLPLLWFRDRRNEFGPASALDGLLSRLATRIEFPVASRVFVRRIEDGMVEKRIGHLQILLSKRTASGAKVLRKSCSPTSSAGDVLSRWGTHFLMDGFQHTVWEKEKV